MKQKPVIGITKPDNEDFLAYSAIWLATKLAGGKPVVVTAKGHEYKDYKLDGLLLGGGKDIFPELYKSVPKADYSYDPARDEMEMFWAREAIEEGIPALGICRGAQLMNIVCGGSLHQSVAEAYSDAHYPDGFIHHAFYRKKIELSENGILHQITGQRVLHVNSIHKQAINRLGADLIVEAKETNGVVQAISNTKHPYFLGIQFHPEFLIYKRVFRLIFRSLVRAAQK